MALAALSPDPSTFRKGRDFAAWTGLTPKQFSSGGKERIGRTSKMGQRDLRRLLIIGAASVVDNWPFDEVRIRVVGSGRC